MRFHKQLQLVCEAHEEDIAKLRQKHAEELWVVQEEARSLREQILFLEAVLPKECRGRVEIPSKAEIDTSRALSPEQGREAVMSKKNINRVKLIDETDIDALSAPWPKQGQEAVFSKDCEKRVEPCSDTETHVSNATSPREKSLQPCLESLNQQGPLTVIDIQVETLERYNVITSPTVRNTGSELFPAEQHDESEGVLESEAQRSRAMDFQGSDVSSTDYAHSTERALRNWESIARLILMTSASGAARLHPVWHKSISRLKCSLVPFFGTEELPASQTVSTNSFSGLFEGIVEGSGLKKEDTNRFVQLTTKESADESEISTKTQSQNFLVLSPSSREKICWDSCSALWCANDFIIFPLQFVDSLDFGDFEETRTLVATIFWTIDIFVSMSTGYYTEDAGLEMRRCMIMKNYAKTWLFFDIAVLTPDWISVFLSSHSFRMGLGILKISRVLRLVRLMRAVRLLPRLWESIGQHNSESVVTLARLLQHIVLMILINHYVACFLLATWQEFEESSQEEFFHTYLQGLHWAIAHSTLGNMDINPTDLFQRLCTCLMLMLSMILFSYFLSNITNAVMHLSSLTAERRKKETSMRQFFSENKVSRKLAGQVWNYVWRYQDLESKTRLQDVKLFTTLPNRMRAELYYQIFLPYLLVHPLFSFYNEMEPEALAMLCSFGIEQTYLHPSEELLLETHHIVKKMFFVSSGSVLYQPYGSRQSDIIEVGCHMWLCEEALWSLNSKVKGTISAGARGSDLMLILPEEFRTMALKFSKSMPFLVSYAQNFISRFNAACADDDDDVYDGGLLFNDAFMIQGLIHSAKIDAGRRFSTNTKKTIISKVFNFRAASFLSPRVTASVASEEFQH